jgi:hypothetical protein
MPRRRKGPDLGAAPQSSILTQNIADLVVLNEVSQIALKIDSKISGLPSKLHPGINESAAAPQPGREGIEGGQASCNLESRRAGLRRSRAA